jgi:hypothetical protein
MAVTFFLLGDTSLLMHNLFPNRRGPRAPSSQRRPTTSELSNSKPIDSKWTRLNWSKKFRE